MSVMNALTPGAVLPTLNTTDTANTTNPAAVAREELTPEQFGNDPNFNDIENAIRSRYNMDGYNMKNAAREGDGNYLYYDVVYENQDNKQRKYSVAVGPND